MKSSPYVLAEDFAEMHAEATAVITIVVSILIEKGLVSQEEFYARLQLLKEALKEEFGRRP